MASDSHQQFPTRSTTVRCAEVRGRTETLNSPRENAEAETEENDFPPYLPPLSISTLALQPNSSHWLNR